MQEEGGYYAIKGFAYQYIVSLIEVLKCNDESKIFYFEQLQDFNDNELIYQIKYKETQHFVNSKIKEPTIKIFSEFLKTKKDYILYVYFPDKSDEILSFKSVKELDKILLNCKIDKTEYFFSDEQKKEFINHFKVVFSKDYIEKNCELIKLISELLSVSTEVAEIFSFNLVTYIINIIINNKSQNRYCTKKELLSYMTSSFTKIVYDYYLKYNHKEKYLKIIKNKYFFEKNINNHNRIFIINNPSLSVSDYYTCICKIIKRFYVTNKKKTMVLSGAPYIYIPNISISALVQLKELLFNTVNFTDGYMYKDSKFNTAYITKKFSAKDNIACKIISVEEDLLSVIDYLNKEGTKIYQFYSEDCIDENKICNSISIKVDEVNDILKILN